MEAVALEILRSRCVDVESQDEADVIVGLLEMILKDCDIKYESISAPEVNVLKRLAIIRLPDFKLNLINPKIIDASDRTISYGEKCPAFPYQFVNCFRYGHIVLENGINKNIIKAEGKEALLIQHEIDHLNGKIFYDRMIRAAIVRDDPRVRLTDFCPCASRKRFSLCCDMQTAGRRYSS